MPIVVLLILWLTLPGGLGAERLPRIMPGEFACLGYQQVDLQRTAENHLYVVGKVNGRRRSVLMDTGWSFTTLSTNAARRLSPSATASTNEPFSVWIPELELGRIRFTNEPARVEHMVFDGQPASFELVLGCDFLRRHFALIDCPGRRLYTRARAPTHLEQSALETTLRRSGFVAVELHLKTPLAITCPARVNGQPVELLVDTGAIWSSLDVRQLDRLGLRALPTLAKVGGVGKTLARPVAVAEATSFSLGVVPVRNASFAIMDLGDWGIAAPGRKLSEVQGILGGSELAATGALIDCHGLKLWLKRSRVKQ